jgi:hypothetical protein
LNRVAAIPLVLGIQETRKEKKQIREADGTNVPSAFPESNMLVKDLVGDEIKVQSALL